MSDNMDEQRRLAEIERLKKLRAEREQLDQALERLVELEDEQARVEYHRRVETECATIAQELKSALADLHDGRSEIQAHFLSVLEPLSKIRELLIEQEQSLQFLARRALRAGRIAASLDASPDSRRAMEQHTSIVTKAIELWQESGGNDPRLIAFPEKQAIQPDLLELADDLVQFLTSGRYVFHPEQSAVFIGNIARPTF